MNEITPDVAALFKRIQDAGLSVPTVAENAGMASTTLTRWRKGVTRPHPMFLKLAHKSLDDLLSRSEAQ